MYLVGAAHPHKAEAQIVFEQLIASGERLVTDAEVLQEILHRYTSIRRRDAIGPAMQVTLEMVDEVYPVEKVDVMRASEIAGAPQVLSARDALHLAIMERHRVSTIFSFDSEFDRWPGLRRLYQV